MEIKVLPLGELGANCYMIKGDKGVVVIDVGAPSKAVENFLIENSDKQRLILLTHCHFDHIGGAEALREATGVEIAIGEDEAGFLADANVNLSGIFGSYLPPFYADKTVKDKETIVVGDIELKAIKVSGHTSGGMCYLCGKNLFSGDVLFYESIGRTDFPTGSFRELEASVKKLYELDGDITVYSGHGEATTIDHERKYNPYVREI